MYIKTKLMEKEIMNNNSLTMKQYIKNYNPIRNISVCYFTIDKGNTLPRMQHLHKMVVSHIFILFHSIKKILIIILPYIGAIFGFLVSSFLKLCHMVHLYTFQTIQQLNIASVAIISDVEKYQFRCNLSIIKFFRIIYNSRLQLGK